MGLFFVRREQKRGYCIMFPVISAGVCGSSFCCAIFNAETPSLYVKCLSKFRAGIARVHTHALSKAKPRVPQV